MGYNFGIPISCIDRSFMINCEVTTCCNSYSCYSDLGPGYTVHMSTYIQTSSHIYPHHGAPTCTPKTPVMSLSSCMAAGTKGDRASDAASEIWIQLQIAT